MVQKELYNVRGPPQGGGPEGKRKAHIPFCALFNQAKRKFTFSECEFISSDHKFIQLCVPSSYSIISQIHINRCQTH